MNSTLPDPVRILGVDTEDIGTPRNDGTPGSALYSVPIKLNISPPSVWAQLFPNNWDQPPEWSNRHRPGIASVVGDRIVLNGTTIEEVRDVHTKTLKLAVETTNAQFEDYEERQRLARQAEREQQAAHQRNIQEVASEIRFD
jgi:hypothetical protein